jgi:hypothetical protein
MIKDKDGQPVVAIRGGWKSDMRWMDVWNPRTHKVKQLWDVIPPSDLGSQGLQSVTSSQIITLKGGDELILYSGHRKSFQDAIWKYTPADNTWKRYPISGIRVES